MADGNVNVSSNKRSGSDDQFASSAAKKNQITKAPPHAEDPAAALAKVRHEFGEHGGVNMSIEASATFTVMEPDTLRRMFAGELGPDRDFFIYSRHFNPTVLNLGRLMAALEGTEAAYCTASGMSAISSVLLQLCSAGDHVVAARTLYGGTHALLTHFLSRACNITTSFVDIRDHEMVKREIVGGGRRIAHEKGVKVVVDNTFAPMVVSPARLGADVVIHSISKYISGGADIIAGANSDRFRTFQQNVLKSRKIHIRHSIRLKILDHNDYGIISSIDQTDKNASIGAVCGPASLLNSMMDLHQGALMLLGPTMNPKVAFELSERLPHLGLRMKEHCHRALTFATRMKKLGLKVVYPGLEDHPDHEVLESIANKDYGHGGIICVDMETEERANRLMNLLQNCTQFGLMAVSLGYYETLMSCSGSSTSSEMNDKEKELAGISPGLVRMSIGYNGTLEQKWGQFENALGKMQDQKM
ncbi:UNVERIFIED_CONTAM: Methionine gamma-lyase [Sesamum latifolium]|uniref:Methionine gamma-lyase n=1 Tax=Sesamum latifolium TaxID=2727402 RepID=A0AAW2SQ90_9LAMI